MVYYQADAVEILNREKDIWLDLSDSLLIDLQTYKFRNDRAYEFARFGLVRRIHMLNHLMRRIFETLPPANSEHPGLGTRLDTEAFLHAHLVNTYGAVDNLARIWCIEASVVDGKGMPIKDGKIGLTDRYPEVRASLPPLLKDYVIKLTPWFEYLANFRHAVAHRVPVYIPPSVLSPEDIANYRKIENDIHANIQANDINSSLVLLQKIRRLGNFVPVMTHTFTGSIMPVEFHGQIICDVATIVNLGRLVLNELDGLDT